MTETTGVASPVSAKPRSHRAPRAPRAPKKAPAKAVTTITNSEAQSARATKRWSSVSAEERSANAREMARQRWAASEVDDAAMQEYFRTEDLDTAMESYQAMRRTFEAAGKILDGRFQAERQADEKCSNPACGKKFSRDVPWYYRNSERNPITGAAYNVFACSQPCMIAVKAVGTQKRA